MTTPTAPTATYEEAVEADAIIEEMIRNAAVEPEKETALRPLQVIHQGDDKVPVPLMVSALQNSGYVRLYHTETGDMSLCNRSWLKFQLKKKLPNGQPVFTIKKPASGPPKGQFKCHLHADDANRAEYDQMGLPVCIAGSLKSEYERDRHLQVKHPTAARTITRIREDVEKQRTERLQEAQLKAMEAIAAQRKPVKAKA